MKRLAHAKRRDLNEPDIVKALRAIGCVVILLDAPADLLVGFRGRWFLLEVKNPDKPPSARKLTEDELTFHRICEAKSLPVAIVLDAKEALMAIGVDVAA